MGKILAGAPLDVGKDSLNETESAPATSHVILIRYQERDHLGHYRGPTLMVDINMYGHVSTHFTFIICIIYIYMTTGLGPHPIY